MRRVIYAVTHTCLLLAALYGGYSFYSTHLAGTTISDCPSRFEAGIMKIGPHVKVNLREAWPLIRLADRCHAGRWKLYEFTGKDTIPAHFIAVWDSSGNALVAFELNELTIERVKGPAPAEFRQSRATDLLAAR